MGKRSRPLEAKPAVIKLKLHPAKAPNAALKYQLLPPFLDRMSGNAAPAYYRALLQMKALTNQKAESRLKKLLEPPLSELSRDEAQDFVNDRRSVLLEVDQAARRDHCDWGVEIRVKDPVASLPWGIVGETRSLVRLLSLQTRVQMRDGKFEDAVHTIQTGFALARHINQVPFLINGLVSLAISSGIFCKSVQELSQLPGTPNLYWALTFLPRPIIDLREALDVEGSLLYLMFPVLRNPETAVRTPDQWRERLVEMLRKFKEEELDEKTARQMSDETLMAPVLKAYPMAREYVIARGLSAEKVEKMPIDQVVAIYTAGRFNERRDEMLKRTFIPSLESSPAVQADSGRFRPHATCEVIPWASALFPNTNPGWLVSLAADRHIAELRLIEALRMYAANHDGKLPSKLSDISDIPLPIDPWTGKAFDYHVKAGVGVLVIGGIPDPSSPMGAKHYELTMEPAKDGGRK